MYTGALDWRFTVPLSSLALVVACSVDSSALEADSATPMPDSGAADTSAVDSSAMDAATDSGGRDATADGAPADIGTDSLVPPDATTDADASGSCTTAPPGVDEMVALPAPPTIALDGDLSDWSWAIFVSVTPSRWRDRAGPAVTSADDLSARAAALWTETDLYLAFEVTDDTHFNDDTGEYLWRGDSIQAAFDVARNGGSPYDDTDDFEYGWARTSSATERYRWVAPSGAATPTDEVVIMRSGSTTIYEVRLSAADLELSSFAVMDRFGISWLVNEMDGPGESQGFIEWTSGIGATKDPSLFGVLTLRSCD